MSSQYTVQSGDTLSGIALKEYGDASYYPRIQAANPSITDPDSIIVGQVINLPDLAEREALKTELAALTVDSDGITILVDSVRVPHVSARIIRTMDTCGDGWSALLPLDLDSEIATKLAPYSYPKASAYIAGDLAVNGVLYRVSPALSDTQRTASIEGNSFTVDIVDSTVQTPYQRSDITLEQLAEELVAAVGINASADFDTGGIFERTTADEQETIFDHLLTYAQQRGGLVSNTVNGDLLITRANTEGEPVGSLVEGENFVTAWGADYDGRQRFNTYTALGQSPLSNKNVSPAIDSRVPRSRFLTFTADDSTDGNISEASIWRRNSQIAKAMAISIPVRGWYGPAGNLWEPNTIVTVTSPTLFIPDGFDFLIRAVEYVETETQRTAVLSLIPPQTYTTEDIEEPW